MIAGTAIPAGLGVGQPNAPVQYLECGLAGTFEVVEGGARGQGNQGLSQRVLVSAVHGVCAVSVMGGRQMVAGERGQRDFVHGGCPGSQRLAGGVSWR